jgi:hypothetical protein
MNISKFKNFILRKVENELSKTLYYHDVNHTLYVMEECNKYIRRYNISPKDAYLIRTAALLHDIGFIWVYRNNEERAAEYAKKILPNWGYSPKDVEIVVGMILATKIPQLPKTFLEQVICDADLNYLGTNAYYPLSNKLFEELKTNNILKTESEWLDLQISFLENHTYHTSFALKNRANKKQMILDELLDLRNNKN